MRGRDHCTIFKARAEEEAKTKLSTITTPLMTTTLITTTTTTLTTTAVTTDYRLGRMVKVGDYRLRGPGFNSRKSQKLFTIYLMDVMISAPMTCMSLNILQKSDGLW